MANIYTLADAQEKSLLENASCAFGVFDGVHRGHRYLIDSAIQGARTRNSKGVILTFDIDPEELFAPEKVKKLMSNEQRIEYLSYTGVDEVVVIKFDNVFSRLSPQEFLRSTFEGASPSEIHVGSDVRFGSRAQGNTEFMQKWAQGQGAHVVVHELKYEEGTPITSTRIRALLGDGLIEKANDLLGHPYTFIGTVIKGRGEGSKLGFRTANMVIPEPLRVLSDGVYAAYAYVDGMRYKAAVSVGISPVFADKATASCEAHILDFSSDLYSKELTIEFTRHIRPLKKFSSVDDLTSTVTSNIQWVSDNLSLDNERYES